MIMLQNNRGMTLIELLVVGCILIIIFGYLFGYLLAVKAFLQGNYWISENKVLQILQMENPHIVSIGRVERNIFKPARLEAIDDQKTVTIYCIDSNILWNYKFVSCL
jgi:hypothetical protein